MYIDVHCHLNDSAFEGKTDEVIAGIKAAGVELVVCSGFDMESSYRAASLAEKYDFIYFSAGFQPQEIGKYKEGDMPRLRELLRHEKCVALGEIGLDYHYPDNPGKEFQKEIFIKQLQLADEEGMPVIIHSRDCAEDMLSILRENRVYLGHGGLLHCYSHSAEQISSFAELGLYFSFGGTSTYANAKKVAKSAAAVPLDKILTETDSPYLTPEPLRGRFPNTPANIPHIAERLAQLRSISVSDFCAAVRANAERLFKKLP